MKAKTFRLDETSLEQLKAIEDAKGVSQADAVRYAIQQGFNAIQVQDTPTKSDDTDWKSMYLREHDALLSLTDKVADGLKAAQTLQAMDKPALESTQQKMERKTRWQRLKEAWRG